MKDNGDEYYLVRRDVLRISIGAIGVLVGACAHRPPAARAGLLAWDRFTRYLVPEAERVFRQHTSEQHYVSHVAGLLRRLDPTLIDGGTIAEQRGILASELLREQQFVVNQYVLPPGRGFPFHDHRDYNAVLMVLRGELHVRQFDLVDSSDYVASDLIPAGQSVLITESSVGTIPENGVSTLTTTKRNIHDVRAGGEGCTMVDLFTWIGPNPRSMYLDVEQHPITVGSTLYRATFK